MILNIKCLSRIERLILCRIQPTILDLVECLVWGVFSTKHQWKAIQHIAAERFQQFVDTEIEIGHTVNVDMNLIEKRPKERSRKSCHWRIRGYQVGLILR